MDVHRRESIERGHEVVPGHVSCVGWLVVVRAEFATASCHAVATSDGLIAGPEVHRSVVRSRSTRDAQRIEVGAASWGATAIAVEPRDGAWRPARAPC